MSTDKEEWRDIRGYEGFYQVSSFGRVRSLDRTLANGIRRQGKVLSPGQDKKKGYLNVGLCKGDGPKRHHVHGLVAGAFLGLRPVGMEVSHKDHDPANNRATNLEYLTHGDNMKHSAATARMGSLSVSDVQDIREIFMADPGSSTQELAQLLGVSRHVIWNVARANTYIHALNRDGSEPKPLEVRNFLTVEHILELQEQGYTIPQIAALYDLDYSTPYQALRRAGIHQPTGNTGTGRRAANLKAARALAAD